MHIHKSIDQIIRTVNDSTFLRYADKTREVKGADLRNLEYSRNIRQYENECNTDAEIDDLDEQLIADYKKRIGAEKLSTYQVLKARGFIRKIHGEEHLTNAAVLLFASTITQFFSNCRIRFIRYNGTSAQVGTQMNIFKDVSIEEPLPRLIEKTKAFIATQLREFTTLDPKTGLFKTQPEYPEFAWLEGIANAVVHREYAMMGNYIRITMYDDRLEILSPGRLPNLVTVDNIQETRFSRNPQIARVLTEFGLVRELNEGVKRIYSDMKKQNLDLPIYRENDQAVILILKNDIENRAIKTDDGTNYGVNGANYGANYGANGTNKHKLSETETSVYDYISSHKNASTKIVSENLGIHLRTVQRIVKDLEKYGFVKKAGNRVKVEWIIL